MFDLEISRREADRLQVFRRRVPLQKVHVRVGRSLRNDVVLLERGVLPEAGAIVRKGTQVLWYENGTSLAVSLLRNSVKIGPYRICAKLSPRIWLAGAAILLICISASVLDLQTRKTKAGALTQPISTAGIPLPARGIFGRQSPDTPNASRIAFHFAQVTPSGVVLHYSPGHVESPDQLAIILNGKPVGFVPACPSHWLIEQRLTLSKEQLRKGINEIRFEVQPDSGAESDWGIRDVYVKKSMVEEALKEDGKSLFEAANKLFQESSSQSGKLVRARQLLERAIGSWRATQGIIPPEALSLEREIAHADELMFSRTMSEARGALSLGDRHRAVQIYDRLLAELIDLADDRRAEVLKARKSASKRAGG